MCCRYSHSLIQTSHGLRDGPEPSLGIKRGSLRTVSIPPPLVSSSGKLTNTSDDIHPRSALRGLASPKCLPHLYPNNVPSPRATATRHPPGGHSQVLPRNDETRYNKTSTKNHYKHLFRFTRSTLVNYPWLLSQCVSH